MAGRGSGALQPAGRRTAGGQRSGDGEARGRHEVRKGAGAGAWLGQRGAQGGSPGQHRWRVEGSGGGRVSSAVCSIPPMEGPAGRRRSASAALAGLPEANRWGDWERPHPAALPRRHMRTCVQPRARRVQCRQAPARLRYRPRVFSCRRGTRLPRPSAICLCVCHQRRARCAAPMQAHLSPTPTCCRRQRAGAAGAAQPTNSSRPHVPTQHPAPHHAPFAHPTCGAL